MANTVSKQLLGGLDAAVVLLSRSGVSEKFIRFAVVGTLGFCWDTGTVYALRGLTGLYVAGVFGFLVAATANWGVNRIWTFRHHVHAAPHRGTFFALISLSTLCHNQPVFPIIAGSIAGLCFNYFLSKRFVFS